MPLLDAVAGARGVRRHSRGKVVSFVLPTRDCPDTGAAVAAKPPASFTDGRVPGLASRRA
ncbi:hypothetical protein [Streptomyces sp. NPDC007264]|uniref:hypothetical protein n=1 Tax=Streptomyces sp. NPDC007264 TaxID=3364777 RepID=UPI0036D886A3